jgi:hypothetical protein
MPVFCISSFLFNDERYFIVLPSPGIKMTFFKLMELGIMPGTGFLAADFKYSVSHGAN